MLHQGILWWTVTVMMSIGSFIEYLLYTSYCLSTTLSHLVRTSMRYRYIYRHFGEEETEAYE